MKKKARPYEIDQAFLVRYRTAALENAAELLEEASLLAAHGHRARAYFLAVASIEETGKAFLAFSAQGRNLSDPGLRARLKQQFDDHSPKISSAFVGWMSASSDQREAIQASVDLIIHLKRGREKAMYVDGATDNAVSRPSTVVRERAARDAVKIATNCLEHTKTHVASRAPPAFTSFDDKLFCMNSDKVQKLFNTPDFGAYLLDRVTRDGGDFNFSKTVVTYHDAYFSKSKTFADKRS